MRLVIDIKEDRYRQIKDMPNAFNSDICQAIRNGTPLPKGHGDLIDRDETLKAMDTWDKFGYVGDGWCVRDPGDDYIPYVYYGDMVRAVSGMPTIIEADEETENE